MSNLFGNLHVYRFTIAYESDKRLDKEEVLSIIRNRSHVSTVRIDEIFVKEGVYRLRIYYQSEKGPLALEKLLPRIREGKEAVIDLEGEQEVENEDGTYTNIDKLTKICDAKGCEEHVYNQTSIYDDDGNLSKTYFLCNEHIGFLQNNRIFELKRK
jgi:hypothetical protein